MQRPNTISHQSMVAVILRVPIITVYSSIFGSLKVPAACSLFDNERLEIEWDDYALMRWLKRRSEFITGDLVVLM